MSQIVIYEEQNGATTLEVHLEAETVWLTQDQMADLFGRDQSVISRHLKTFFKEGVLDPKNNMQNMHIANSKKPVAFYDLDSILYVGYRVNSKQGNQFRQWATNLLVFE